MLKRSQNPVIASVLALTCLAASPISAGPPGLVQTLVGELGVTDTQAAGGAAAILGLAKNNLGSSDYLALVEAVPEVAELLGSSGTASTASALGSALGALSGAGEGEESGDTPEAPAGGSAAAAMAGIESAASALIEGVDEEKTGELAAASEAASEPSSGKSASGSTLATVASAASALGIGAEAEDLSKAAGLASLAGSFSDLGLDSEMIGRFVPVILEYVGGKGGDTKAALLKSALGLL
jgi:hypothetical protein